MRTYSKNELVNLLDKATHEKLDPAKKYLVEKVSANKLVTHNRLDLGFRTLYLQLRKIHPNLALEIYRLDVHAQSLGKYIDQDNAHKTDFDVWIKEFDDIFIDISNNGFNPAKSIIPLAQDGSILNGAHRVSAALVQNKDVYVVMTDLPPLNINFKYFYERLVPEEFIKMAIYQLLKYTQNTYLAFLWPTISQNFESVKRQFSNPIYVSEILLSPLGQRNLLYECYQHMDWVGENTNLDGIRIKQAECFPQPFSQQNGSKAICIIFQSVAREDVLSLKESIRKQNNIGNSSIHITDDSEETLRIGQFILNSNALHFLNNSTKFIHATPKINALKKIVCEEKINTEDFVIDGSLVLEAYGFREAQDYDLLIHDSLDKTSLKKKNRGESDYLYHDKPKLSLMYDPRYYFEYRNLKFVSLEQIQNYKTKRNENKDQIDLEIIDSKIRKFFLKTLVTIIK